MFNKFNFTFLKKKFKEDTVSEVLNEAVVDAEPDTVEEPVGEEPVVEDPVGEEPVVEEPVVEELVVEEPVVEEPVAENEVVREDNSQFAEQVRADIQVFAIGLQNQLDRLTECVLKQNELIGALQSELQAKDELLNQQEETIRTQSMRLEKFNDDIIYKTQKPLIEELIGIADFVRMVLGNNEVIEGKDFDTLLNYVVRLKDWVAASLSNNSVKEYSLSEDDPKTFDPKKQEITDNEFTDNPDLDNTYKTDRPGYIWTMPYLIVNNEARMKRILEETKAPKMYEFIIRCEEVIKIRYRKPVETKTETNE